MLYFFYFIFLYCIEFIFNFFFGGFLDMAIFLFANPLLDKKEKEKLNINFFFYKEIEKRKEKKKFTKFNEYFFFVKIIDKYISNKTLKNFFFKVLLDIYLNFFKFYLKIFNFFYINFHFFFFLKIYKEDYYNSFFIASSSKLFFIFSYFKFFNLKEKFINILDSLIIEMFNLFLALLRIFWLSFLKTKSPFNMFIVWAKDKEKDFIKFNTNIFLKKKDYEKKEEKKKEGETKKKKNKKKQDFDKCWYNLLTLSRNYFLFLLKGSFEVILKLTFLENLVYFFIEKIYWYFLFYVLQVLNIFIRNHYIFGAMVFIFLIFLFFFFYIFIYVFFFFFSFILFILLLFFFIFLFTLNLDSVVFFHFNSTKFFVKLNETKNLYKQLVIVFFYNSLHFLLGDTFFSYNFCFRKFVYFFILVAGYFHYFLLFIIIFYLIVNLILFFFSYLKPFLECLFEAINVYIKRANFKKWEADLRNFFSSFIFEIFLVDFLVYIFSQKFLLIIIDFWLNCYILGLESFCRKPLYFYIFYDFLVVFERLVKFYSFIIILFELRIKFFQKKL